MRAFDVSISDSRPCAPLVHVNKVRHRDPCASETVTIRAKMFAELQVRYMGHFSEMAFHFYRIQLHK